MRLTPLNTILFLIGITLVVAGCDSNGSPDPQLSDVVMSPETATLEVGETADFSIELLDEDGDPIAEPDAEIRWWSSDPDVFTVAEDGLVTAIGEGEAKCMVEVTNQRFVGRDSAFVTVMF